MGQADRRLFFLTDKHGVSPLHAAASRGHVDVSRLLVERGGTRLLAAKNKDSDMAEGDATRLGHGALADMLRRARVAKARSDVWGHSRPCVSAEMEVLAAARAAAAMAELLAEEAKPPVGGAAGTAGGSGFGGAARGRKGRGGFGKKN